MTSDQGWRGSVLRILSSGVGGKEDWPLAKELIDRGWGYGNASPDGGGNGISKLDWQGPTLEGRFAADDIRSDLAKRTIRYRIWQGFTHAVAWAAGVSYCLVADWVRTFL